MSAAPPLAKKGKFVQQKLCFGMPTANPEISIAAVTATTTTTSLSSLDTATTSFYFRQILISPSHLFLSRKPIFVSVRRTITAKATL